MNSTDLEALRVVVGDLHHEPPIGGEISQACLNASPFFKAKLSPQGTLGLRHPGFAALGELTKALYEKSATYQLGATFSWLLNRLFDFLLEDYVSAKLQSYVVDALYAQSLEQRLAQAFVEKSGSYYIYEPCVLPPRPSRPFAVGPVQFSHLQDFEARLPSDTALWQTSTKLVAAMKAAGAFWMAEVEIHSALADRAQELAALAVDLALVAIELVSPQDYLRQMGRLYGRGIPTSRLSVYRVNGQLHEVWATQQPGLVIGDGLLGQNLSNGAEVVTATGNRITAFLSRKAKLQTLEQAWADAAYWFREGLTEPIDTIAVTKLETCVEVLFRAESTSGSKSRLLTAMEVFYGLSKDQFIRPGSTTTVEAFVKRLVTDRSRILHGTWSTLSAPMLDGRQTMEQLAGNLLVNFLVALERYSADPAAANDLNTFLDWAKANGERQKLS